MLGLTRKADYGLRLMLEVASAQRGVVRTAHVARRQQIPYQFLRKVAQTLVASGLLASERGPRGGLSLARPAQDISVLDIVGTFDAPALNRCTMAPPTCDRRDCCAVFPVWARAQAQVERILSGALLSQLALDQTARTRAARHRPARRR